MVKARGAGLRAQIISVAAREVLDSRGNPTVEAVVNGCSALVPSGASAGRLEALELRDGGPRYGGKGVLRAVSNINKIIAKKISGRAFTQTALDAFLNKLDGTPSKKKLGANAILAVSAAFARACARENGLPPAQYFAVLSGNKKPGVPCPAANLVNGGAHAGTALSMQEFLVLPVGVKTFSEETRAVCETRLALRDALVAKYGASAKNVGDEGGFAPPCKTQEEPLELLERAVEQAGYARKIFLGVDAAATQFYDAAAKKYLLGSRSLSPGELNDYCARLCARFPLRYVEDPFQEDAFADFAALRGRIPHALVVGDDLLCTNPARIRKAVGAKACNAAIIKMNQIGSITGAIEAALLARRAGWKLVVSHRSGETEDALLADFAAGLNAEFIKLGAPCRGERTAKYNELLRIESSL